MDLNHFKGSFTFFGWIFLSFVVHFSLCLAIRGYPAKYSGPQYSIIHGDYGDGLRPQEGSGSMDDLPFPKKNNLNPKKPRKKYVSLESSIVVLKKETIVIQENLPSKGEVEEGKEITRTRPVVITKFIEEQESSTASSENMERYAQGVIPTQEEIQKNPALQVLENKNFPEIQNPLPSQYANQLIKTTPNIYNQLTNNISTSFSNNGTGRGGALGGKGPQQQASPIRNPYPSYPSSARAEGIEGEVAVRIWITAEGLPDHVDILNSSGHVILDDQVVKTITKRWKFIPAKQRGKAVESIEECVFRFILNEQ